MKQVPVIRTHSSIDLPSNINGNMPNYCINSILYVLRENQLQPCVRGYENSSRARKGDPHERHFYGGGNFRSAVYVCFEIKVFQCRDTTTGVDLYYFSSMRQ